MWREGVPVCIISILQLYTSPSMSTPGESLPGPHIRMSISMLRAHGAREEPVQLSVVARLMEVWVNAAGRTLLGVSVL